MPRRTWSDPLDQQAAREEDLATRIAALERRLAGLTPERWHYVGAAGEPAFVNGWTNYGSGHTRLRFRREGWDVVRIEGIIGNPGMTNGAHVFVLPVGYRPPERIQNPIRAEPAVTYEPFINVYEASTPEAGYVRVYGTGGSGVVSGSIVLTFTFTFSVAA